MRTCVGILRVSIEMSFGVFLQFSFYPYNYYGELYLFDESVDVPMRNCCEIDVCCLCLDPVMILNLCSGEQMTR